MYLYTAATKLPISTATAKLPISTAKPHMIHKVGNTGKRLFSRSEYRQSLFQRIKLGLGRDQYIENSHSAVFFRVMEIDSLEKHDDVIF